MTHEEFTDWASDNIAPGKRLSLDDFVRQAAAVGGIGLPEHYKMHMYELGAEARKGIKAIVAMCERLGIEPDQFFFSDMIVQLSIEQPEELMEIAPPHTRAILKTALENVNRTLDPL